MAKKESPKDKRIRSIKGFIDWTNTLPEKGNFIFRGQVDGNWPLRSGAARRLFGLKPTSPVVANEVIKYSEDLIERARNKGLHHHHRNLDSCLEILAELQHNGAATPLFDFSRNALAALWMACCSDSEKDGKVFAIDYSGEDVERITNKETNTEIRTLLGDDKIRIWEPPGQNERILAQGSFFLLAREPYDESKLKLRSVKISKGSKEQIIKYLGRINGLSEENIFPDLPGFARANAADKPIRPKDTVSLFRIARNLHQQGNFTEAISYYDRVIDIDANNSDAYFYRGNAKRDLKHYAGAIEDYDKTIELKPDYVFAYNNRGLVKYELQQYADALKDYDKAIELKPDYAFAYNNRGLVKYDLKHYAEAIEDYDKAIELKPDYAFAYNNRGNVNRALMNYPEALKDYDKAIELKPDYAFAYNNRGLVKYDLMHYAEAIEDYDKAIELKPDYALAYNNRGLVYQAVHKKVESRNDYEKALELAKAQNDQQQIELAKKNLASLDK